MLIKDIYKESKKYKIPLNFEDGLAGISWGIEYLVHDNFLEGDTDLILTEFDDRICRHLLYANREELSIGVMRGAMGYIVYILSRLKKTNSDTTNKQTDSIFRRLIIELINHISESIEKKMSFLQDPLSFNVFWELPLFLILLADIKALNFYNNKINRLIEYLTPRIISLFPQRADNKLYLLLGLNSILQQYSIKAWKHHAELLKKIYHQKKYYTKILRIKI